MSAPPSRTAQEARFTIAIAVDVFKPFSSNFISVCVDDWPAIKNDCCLGVVSVQRMYKLKQSFIFRASICIDAHLFGTGNQQNEWRRGLMKMCAQEYFLTAEQIVTPTRG